MTSNLAFSYGREVYAVPGRIDDIGSQGCNRLIRNKVAEAVTGEDELLESLGFRPGTRRNVSDRERIQKVYEGSLSANRLEAMTGILMTIRKKRGITVEDLAAENGLEYQEAAMLTGLLESDGMISIDLLQRCCINAGK